MKSLNKHTNFLRNDYADGFKRQNSVRRTLSHRVKTSSGEKNVTIKNKSLSNASENPSGNSGKFNLISRSSSNNQSNTFQYTKYWNFLIEEIKSKLSPKDYKSGIFRQNLYLDCFSGQDLIEILTTTITDLRASISSSISSNSSKVDANNNFNSSTENIEESTPIHSTLSHNNSGKPPISAKQTAKNLSQKFLDAKIFYQVHHKTETSIENAMSRSVMMPSEISVNFKNSTKFDQHHYYRFYSWDLENRVSNSKYYCLDDPEKTPTLTRKRNSAKSLNTSRNNSQTLKSHTLETPQVNLALHNFMARSSVNLNHPESAQSTTASPNQKPPQKTPNRTSQAKNLMRRSSSMHNYVTSISRVKDKKKKAGKNLDKFQPPINKQKLDTYHFIETRRSTSFNDFHHFIAETGKSNRAHSFTPSLNSNSSQQDPTIKINSCSVKSRLPSINSSSHSTITHGRRTTKSSLNSVRSNSPVTPTLLPNSPMFTFNPNPQVEVRYQKSEKETISTHFENNQKVKITKIETNFTSPKLLPPIATQNILQKPSLSSLSSNLSYQSSENLSHQNMCAPKSLSNSRENLSRLSFFKKNYSSVNLKKADKPSRMQRHHSSTQESANILQESVSQQPTSSSFKLNQSLNLSSYNLQDQRPPNKSNISLKSNTSNISQMSNLTSLSFLAGSSNVLSKKLKRLSLKMKGSMSSSKPSSYQNHPSKSVNHSPSHHVEIANHHHSHQQHQTGSSFTPNLNRPSPRKIFTQANSIDSTFTSDFSSKTNENNTYSSLSNTRTNSTIRENQSGKSAVDSSLMSLLSIDKVMSEDVIFDLDLIQKEHRTDYRQRLIGKLDIESLSESPYHGRDERFKDL